MPNIEDVLKALKSLADFAENHPYVAIPTIAVVLVMAITGLVKSFKEQLGWVADIITKGTRQQRFVLLIAAVCIALVAVASPILVVHYRRPKPIFLDTKTAVMTGEFNARWSYSEDHNGSVKYHLVAETATAHEEATTTIPYHKVGLTGKVTLRVTAINKDGSKRTSDPFEIEIYRDSIQRFQATGHLVVGIHADDNAGIFCFNSPDAGYQGFDIDLSKEIARRIAAKHGIPYRDPEFSFYHWPELLSQPTTYDVDFIIASISKSHEREEKYGLRFSNPYYTTELGLIEKKGPSGKITYPELMKLKLGINSTTTAAAFAHTLKLNATTAPTKQEVFALLADGKVDGILYDYVRSVSEAEARQWVTRQIDYATIPTQLRPSAEQYSIATAPLNDTLLSEINDAIAGTDTKKMINDRLQPLRLTSIHH